MSVRWDTEPQRPQPIEPMNEPPDEKGCSRLGCLLLCIYLILFVIFIILFFRN